MSDATDVLHAIDQLHRSLSGYHGQLKAINDLQRHCDNQRQRICELEGLYAKAKEEIAGLREQTRWMAQTDSRWEATLRDLEQAKAENDKLRDLVKVMPRCRNADCDGCPMAVGVVLRSGVVCMVTCMAESKLRELGVGE